MARIVNIGRICASVALVALAGILASCGDDAPKSRVVFDTGEGGSVVPPQFVPIGGKAIRPPKPRRDGHDFYNWFLWKEDTKRTPLRAFKVYFDFSTPITSNITLHAEWVASANIVFLVKFSTGGIDAEGVDPVAVNANDRVKQPNPPPSRTGYTFSAWSAVGAGPLDPIFDFSTSITKETTLYAQWTPNPGVPQHTVTFNRNDVSGGTSTTTDVRVPQGATTLSLTPASRPGYSFAGWYEKPDGSGTQFSFISRPIIADITLYAKWTPTVATKYTVTFDSNDGLPDASRLSTQDTPPGFMAAPPADPTKSNGPNGERYSFAGWYTSSSGGVKFDFTSTPITADITLYAQWKLIHTVTFFVNSSSTTQNVDVVDGDAVSRPTDPTSPPRQTFIGWYLPGDRNQYVFSAPVTSDLRLDAVWVPQKQYTVTFDSQNGQPTTSLYPVDHGKTISEPGAPTRTANGARYSFDGWYTSPTGGVKFDFTSTSITSDTTLYAQWTPPVNRKVTFDLQQGQGTAPLPRIVLDGAMTAEPAPQPTRPGYTFDDWYTSPTGGVKFDFTSTPITADITLYAQWIATATVYRVTFDYNGGTGAPAFDDVNSGSMVPRPSDPTRAGYWFLGWLDANGHNYAFTEQVTVDITIKANWTLAQQTIKLLTFDTGPGGPAVQSIVIPYNSPTMSVLNNITLPKKPNYRFDYWYENDVNKNYFTSPPTYLTRNIKLTAKWTPDNSIVTGNPSNGNP